MGHNGGGFNIGESAGPGKRQSTCGLWSRLSATLQDGVSVDAANRCTVFLDALALAAEPGGAPAPALFVSFGRVFGHRDSVSAWKCVRPL
jgi:hypothetical protein